MINIILNKCQTCDDTIKSNIKIIDGILEYKSLCSFCFGREKKIKSIKQKITDLQWQLYNLEEIQTY
jgi:hypothetical protein